jgi:hypothetical protein
MPSFHDLVIRWREAYAVTGEELEKGDEDARVSITNALFLGSILTGVAVRAEPDVTLAEEDPIASLYQFCRMCAWPTPRFRDFADVENGVTGRLEIRDECDDLVLEVHGEQDTAHELKAALAICAIELFHATEEEDDES